ncbi:MAG: hypothetical protein NVSMB1_09990 [Polyangiales bacterium]
MIQPAFGTPRKLPRARDLKGRVAVVDIAFAYDTPTDPGRFDKVTRRFIDDLGPRLVAWVDHHDHQRHRDFERDPRFVLSTKAMHPACPEMVTAELVAAVGPIDTILCHTDFDGLCAAAKWMRKGVEPYLGADEDARAIDTRTGIPSSIGDRFDRALRGRPHDEGLFGMIVRHLAQGLSDPSLWVPIDAAAAEYKEHEAEARRLAQRYVRLRGESHGIAYADVTPEKGTKRRPYDKTLLLLLGQERETISVVLDRDTVSLAAPFKSGVDFLKLLDLSGGMPTRVSVPRDRLPAVWSALGVADPPHASAFDPARQGDS